MLSQFYHSLFVLYYFDEYSVFRFLVSSRGLVIIMSCFSFFVSAASICYHNAHVLQSSSHCRPFERPIAFSKSSGGQFCGYHACIVFDWRQYSKYIFYSILDYFLPRAAPLSFDPLPVARLAAGFGLADELSSSSSLPSSSSDSFAFSSTAWTKSIGNAKCAEK